jgi:hypothetical protein
MADDYREMAAAARGRRGPSLIGLIRRLVILGFGVVQLILIARIALDLGYLPDAVPADLVIAWSDAVAAPVEQLAAAVLGPGGRLGFLGWWQIEFAGAAGPQAAVRLAGASLGVEQLLLAVDVRRDGVDHRVAVLDHGPVHVEAVGPQLAHGSSGPAGDVCPECGREVIWWGGVPWCGCVLPAPPGQGEPDDAAE